MVAGIIFILSHGPLRFYVLFGFLWRLFLASQLPLFIVYVKNYLQGSTQDYSLFMMCLAIGGAAGSFIAGGIENVWTRRTLVYGGLGASYLFFALLPVSKNFLLALLLIGLSNLSFYVALVAIHSDVQQFTPNDMRGKVFASAPTIFVPIGLISILIASPLADRVGVEWVFLFSGMMALITLPWVGWLNQLSSQLLEPLLKPKAPADRDVNGVSKRF